MRLTINLDDELYAMARSHAVATNTSLSKAVGDLLRRRIMPTNLHQTAKLDENAAFSIDPETLLPVVRGEGRAITIRDMEHANDDEDIRHLETMGLTPDEIQQSINR